MQITSHKFSHKHLTGFYYYLSQSDTKHKPLFLLAHGWGASHHSMMKIAEKLCLFGRVYLVDFPGFGQSSIPEQLSNNNNMLPTQLGTKQYTEYTAQLIKHLIQNIASKTEDLERQKQAGFIYIGHSFGGRIGIQLAEKHPELLKGLVMIATPGLVNPHPTLQLQPTKVAISLYNKIKPLLPRSLSEKITAQIRRKIYQKNGAYLKFGSEKMIPVFNSTIRDNYQEIAPQVKTKTVLIYASHDRETPYYLGEAFNKLIPNCELHKIEFTDHFSILNEGAGQVVRKVKLAFLEQF